MQQCPESWQPTSTLGSSGKSHSSVVTSCTQNNFLLIFLHSLHSLSRNYLPRVKHPCGSRYIGKVGKHSLGTDDAILIPPVGESNPVETRQKLCTSNCPCHPALPSLLMSTGPVLACMTSPHLHLHPQLNSSPFPD